jgi:hypothetical protein
MLCDACVEIVLKALVREAGCITNLLGNCCTNKECERSRLMDGIHKFTKPNPDARNEYSALKDLAKNENSV